MSLKDSILSHSNQFNAYKEKSEKLTSENEKLKNENKSIKEEIDLLDKYENGISVIIPTYKGENHIKNLLESLENQRLDSKYYELIFIINGELDSTIDILTEFIKNNSKLNVNLYITPESGASNARNIGIELSKKEFITFLDDDDFISPNYLEKLFEYSKPNRITMANFIDYDANTKETNSQITSSIKEHGIIKGAPFKIMSLAAVTVGKSIPTYTVKRIRFNTALNSGEDVSFYAYLYAKFDFEFYFINKNEEVNYYRIERDQSVSNQDMSYQFNVLDRLIVMDDLDENYRIVKTDNVKKYLKNCFYGQAGFIQRYLEKHPEDKNKALEEIEKHDFLYFPYKLLE